MSVEGFQSRCAERHRADEPWNPGASTAPWCVCHGVGQHTFLGLGIGVHVVAATDIRLDGLFQTPLPLVAAPQLYALGWQV